MSKVIWFKFYDSHEIRLFYNNREYLINNYDSYEIRLFYNNRKYLINNYDSNELISYPCSYRTIAQMPNTGKDLYEEAPIQLKKLYNKLSSILYQELTK